jgi:hypothetical protein
MGFTQMGKFKEWLVVTVLRFQMWVDVNLFGLQN